MTPEEADLLYAQVQELTTPQLHTLWKWLFLELIARWRRGDIYYRLEEGR